MDTNTATTTMSILLAVVGLFTLVNLAILGLSLKLYTEYMKDKSMDGRMKNKS